VILVGTGTGTYTAQTVGTNGHILTANSALDYGVEWAAAPIILPTQTGQSGKILTTNGSTAAWVDSFADAFLMMGA